jgi:DNA polymerase-1
MKTKRSKKEPEIPEYCKNCGLLGQPRVEPFSAVSHPKLMIVGEAPGAAEVAEGRPFVGRAGELLTKVMKSINVKYPYQAYYTNACLCRPPENRKPKASEMKCCRQRLLDEIIAVQPELIISLGNTPTTSLIGKGKGISKRRGFYKTMEIKNGKNMQKFGVYPTYHPSAVLRTPETFPDFARELARAYEILNGDPPIVEPPYENYVIIETQMMFELMLKRMKKKKFVTVDIETDGFDFMDGKILCIGFSWKRETACVVDWPLLLENNPENIARLNAVLSVVPCSFHGGPFDTSWLIFRNILANYWFDTMLGHYAVDERQATHGLKRLAVQYYKAPDYGGDLQANNKVVEEDLEKAGYKNVERVELFKYCGADCDYTFRLTEDLTVEMEEQGVSSVLFDILIPAAKHFTELRIEGIAVDQDYMRKMGRQWRREIKEIEAKLRSYKGAETLNFNSSKKLSEFLFDNLKLKPFGWEKLDAGAQRIPEELISEAIQDVDDKEAIEYWRSKRTIMNEGGKGAKKGMGPRSSCTYMLYWLKQQHEFPALLIQYKILMKKYSTYYKGIKKFVWRDGRVRPQYIIWGTRSGRFASKGPALHNLPRGDIITNMFVADPGWTLIHADYSQAEMRMMRHLSKDKKLKKLLDTTDIHTAVTKELFHISDEDLKNMDPTDLKNKRIAAKMITFGIVFGRSPKGLAPQLGITVEAAEAYTKKYFELMPDLYQWILKQHRIAERDQCIVSVFGRKRRFDFIRDKYHLGEIHRQSQNFPIQSSTNDVCFFAHYNVVKALREQGIECKVWPHIHDAITVSVKKHLVEPATKILVETMCKMPFETDVPFGVEAEVGTSWGTMEVVHKS